MKKYREGFAAFIYGLGIFVIIACVICGIIVCVNTKELYSYSEWSPLGLAWMAGIWIGGVISGSVLMWMSEMLVESEFQSFYIRSIEEKLEKTETVATQTAHTTNSNVITKTQSDTHANNTASKAAASVAQKETSNATVKKASEETILTSGMVQNRMLLITYKTPKNITYIGPGALAGCSVLEEIWISNSVKTLGSLSFSNCLKLKRITYDGTKEQWYAIEKGLDWDYNTGNYTVYCTDGEIGKQ